MTMGPVKMVWWAMALSLASGCAIRTQAPIREVAYDFSDADFYDRAYAPSPDYGASEPGPLEAPDQAVTAASERDVGVVDVATLPPGEAVEIGPP